MVDDNPADLEIASIVREKMTDFTGRFVPFTSGPEALSHLAAVWAQEQERPDVIMLDVNMPRMSGLAVLRTLRQDPRGVTLPVVMFSTSANEEMFARRDGAMDYVVKPIFFRRYHVRFSWRDRPLLQRALPALTDTLRTVAIMRKPIGDLAACSTLAGEGVQF